MASVRPPIPPPTIATSHVRVIALASFRFAGQAHPLPAPVSTPTTLSWIDRPLRLSPGLHRASKLARPSLSRRKGVIGFNHVRARARCLLMSGLDSQKRSVSATATMSYRFQRLLWAQHYAALFAGC